jgi:predicted metal-binding membrane protein
VTDVATIQRSVRLNRRAEVTLLLALLAAAAVAWIVTADRMAGMDAGPGTELGGVGWFLVGWAVMMAAMMLPSVVPTTMAFARVHGDAAGSRLGSSLGATALFVASYLVPWVLFGGLAYAFVEGVRALDVGFLAWDEAGPYVAGGVILGAALYELIPVKRLFLDRCRNPSFRAGGRASRPLGVVSQGIAHGGVCVGCCWALMAALFALGVMSIGWMVFVAVLIGAAKLLPGGLRVGVPIALALSVLAVLVTFAPEDAPGLTVPGSPTSMRAMDAMGMDGGGQDAMPAPEPMESMGH